MSKKNATSSMPRLMPKKKENVEQRDATPKLAKRFVPPADTPGAVVKCVTVSRGSTPAPIVVYVDDETRKRLSSRVPPRRLRVLPDELLARDPEYATALSRALRTIIEGVGRLENLTTHREPEEDILRFRRALRSVLDAYLAPLNGDR